MARTNLNFHLTFKPERQYLSSLLSEIVACSGLDIQEISNLTGIPTGKSSGKVEPMICYAEYMGLITKEKSNGLYTLNLTNLGECIVNEDTGLLEKLSLLALHIMLVRPFTGAELWAHVFNNVFPKYRNKLTQKQFNKEIEIQFGSGIKLAPFYGCYQDLLGPLNMLRFDEETIELKPAKIDSDLVYLYAFGLFQYWSEWLKYASVEETQLASENEITALHLSKIGFRNPFGWNEAEEYQALELIAKKGIIVLNRQMVPFSIRKAVEIETVIERLYSELC